MGQQKHGRLLGRLHISDLLSAHRYVGHRAKYREQSTAQVSVIKDGKEAISCC